MAKLSAITCTKIILTMNIDKTLGFSGGSEDKESACNAGDVGSVPGLGRSPGEGNGNPLHYSWKMPGTEEPGKLWSMALQKSQT